MIRDLKNDYLFTSERLGFRNWTKNDLTAFGKMNADLDVMTHFPKPLSKNETSEFMIRLQKHYKKYGYTYFATEILKTGELIGFIGLAFQDYETKFTPATDIGWRLKKSSWGNGYATEGAKRCLDFGFNEIKLKRIIATCTLDNSNSENVMKKIGMEKVGVLKHPRLKEYPDFEKCTCYEIAYSEWQKNE